MKNAKQITFILIGVAMILLAVGLVFMKRSNNTTSRQKGEESGTEIFVGEVNSLVFEAGACTIEVLTGDADSYLLTYDGLKYGDLTHRLENGNLKISYKHNDNWTAKMFVDNDINDQKITLTVPKNAVFDSALFEFGAAEIEMEGITAKELYVTVGAGTLNAENLTATGLAKFNVGAGAFYAEDTALMNAELVCGVGEMNVTGIFDGDTKVDCGVGAMELAVNGEQEQYHGELNCGLGEIDFGEIDIEGNGKKTYGTSSAERRMDIKCGIGEVDVRFYN